MSVSSVVSGDQTKSSPPKTKPVDHDYQNWWKPCDLSAFWIFGLSNNFSYVVMLSAAVDIVQQNSPTGPINSTLEREKLVCEPVLDVTNHRSCSDGALGPILLADVVPLFLIKCTFPFLMHRMSFGFQHVLAVFMQTLSYLIVAFSDNITTSLIGVVFASIGSGIGEVCYLALASHYSKHMISAWSSGTGGAGIFGALVYAVLTEPHLANLTPQVTLLSMLIVPAFFFATYFLLLSPSPTVYPIMKLTKPSTWLVLDSGKTKLPFSRKSSNSDPEESESNACRDGPYVSSTVSIASVEMVEVNPIHAPSSFNERLRLMTPLYKYMIPLCGVYFFQYLISQGLAEFTVFDCDHSFGLDLKSQYRWYQVVSQLGVFITRSSVSFCQLPVFVLFFLPFLQIANAATFFFDSFNHFVPHLWITFVLMLVQGLIAGASYANSFYRIHKEVDPAVKEFSLAITSAANAVGIALAGVASIPIHKFVCAFNQS